MPKPNAAALAILQRIHYMTVATVDPAGQPWNTPVAGVYDDDFNFYWASWTDNQHSRNIRQNGRAFIVVYDSTPEDSSLTGVYIQAKAVELQKEAEVQVGASLYKDDLYNPSEAKFYLGDYPRRIYKAIPKNFWINSDSEIGGNFVDIRVLANR